MDKNSDLKSVVINTLDLNKAQDIVTIDLKDTVKAVAEELQIKPTVINKAIKIAHKGDWNKHEEEWTEIESILGITKNLPDDVSGPRADDE